MVGGLLFFYILVIPYLGFLFTSFLAMSSFIYILGERRKVHIFATSFFLVGLIYLFFTKLMMAPLPRGIAIFKQLSYYIY